MTDRLKEIEGRPDLRRHYEFDNEFTQEDRDWLVKEVKRLRKLVPKDDRNMKTWKLNFENVWAEYPEKKGKHAAWLSFKNQVKTTQALLNISKALVNYKNDMARIRVDHPERPWLHGSTWFNHRWEDFIDYKAPGKAVKEHKPKTVEPLKAEECVDPRELQKMVKQFNRGLKSVPKASNKFVEPVK